MTEEKANEMVLCLTLEDINEKRGGRDNVPFSFGAMAAYGNPKCRVMVRRGDAEESTTHVQVIPYCVLTQGGKVLAYTRSKAGGEARLHEKLSIGFGGHINPVDIEENENHPHLACIIRELQEELSFSTEDPMNMTLHNVGWFYDTSNDVSKVHVCNMHVLPLEDHITVAPNENAIADLHWYTVEELRASEVWERLESWSQKAVEGLEHLIQQELMAMRQINQETPTAQQ